MPSAEVVNVQTGKVCKTKGSNITPEAQRPYHSLKSQMRQCDLRVLESVIHYFSGFDHRIFKLSTETLCLLYLNLCSGLIFEAY